MAKNPILNSSKFNDLRKSNNKETTAIILTPQERRIVELAMMNLRLSVDAATPLERVIRTLELKILSLPRKEN